MYVRLHLVCLVFAKCVSVLRTRTSMKPHPKVCHRVNLKGLLNLPIFCFHKFFAADDPGVIDQNCDFANFVLHKLGYSINVVSATTVTLITTRLEAESFNFFHRSFVSSLIYVDADHYRSKLGEFERQHATKTTSRTRKENDFSINVFPRRRKEKLKERLQALPKNERYDSEDFDNERRHRGVKTLSGVEQNLPDVEFADCE